MQTEKVNNSFLVDKVKLRIKHLPLNEEISVLDAYSGKGRIWQKISGFCKVPISVVRIDKERDEDDVAMLIGDNVKFMGGMDLDQFNVIDLDAYGVPDETLRTIFARKKKTGRAVVFFTFIRVGFGGIPRAMLSDLGYSEGMVKKCPTLFNKVGLEKFKAWLALNGVEKIFYIVRDRQKVYGGFYW